MVLTATNNIGGSLQETARNNHVSYSPGSNMIRLIKEPIVAVARDVARLYINSLRSTYLNSKGGRFIHKTASHKAIAHNI